MVYKVIAGPVFLRWLGGLRDLAVRQRIVSRIDRFRDGNPGDIRPVGEGVTEMRIHYGPGYRVYYKRTGDAVYLLLCGGDKSSQDRDIATALRLARETPK
jgi:putative addiction module killer protein